MKNWVVQNTLKLLSQMTSKRFTALHIETCEMYSSWSNLKSTGRREWESLQREWMETSHFIIGPSMREIQMKICPHLTIALLWMKTRTWGHILYVFTDWELIKGKTVLSLYLDMPTCHLGTKKVSGNLFTNQKVFCQTHCRKYCMYDITHIKLLFVLQWSRSHFKYILLISLLL